MNTNELMQRLQAISSEADRDELTYINKLNDESPSGLDDELIDSIDMYGPEFIALAALNVGMTAIENFIRDNKPEGT